jgi:hypothetical protein
MNNRFKITLHREPSDPFRPGPLSRFKMAMFGILAVVIAFAALVVALLIGWVIAAILGTILIFATLATLLTASFRKK